MRNKNAPATKSSWSITGNFPPLFMLILLLTKLLHKSPNNAPNVKQKRITKKLGKKLKLGNAMLSAEYVWIKPMPIPKTIPPISPFHVFPSPKTLFPSKNFFPKSTGVPPPAITAKEFAA